MNIPQIKENAYDFVRYAYNGDERLTEKLAEFYQEGIKNPTVAKLVSKQAIHDGTQRYNEYLQEDIMLLRGKPIDLIKEYVGRMFLAMCNITEAEQKSPVKELYEDFNKRFRQLYPQTYKLREKLLSEERVCLNEIKPCLQKSIKKTLKFARYV